RGDGAGQAVGAEAHGDAATVPGPRLPGKGRRPPLWRVRQGGSGRGRRHYAQREPGRLTARLLLPARRWGRLDEPAVPAHAAAADADHRRPGRPAHPAGQRPPHAPAHPRFPAAPAPGRASCPGDRGSRAGPGRIWLSQRGRDDVTPVTDADFYLLEQTLEPSGRDLLHRIRSFLEKEVQPVINQYWIREEFPHDIVAEMRSLGIAGLSYDGYGCPGGGCLLDGMLAMELARVDSSIATFFGVHSGLAMGSIYLCGSEEQKQRWLPAMARMEKIGAFGLTEPEVGSGAARGLTTTARRVKGNGEGGRGAGGGDTWILDGQKKWIGNATFADYVIIWARDVEDNQVKGFVVEPPAAGFSTTKMRDKIALRVVQNATITLDGVRVPEASRLQNAN